MRKHLLILATLLLLPAATCDSVPTDLPPGDVKSADYWGDYFLDKYEAERELFNTQIEPGPEPIAQPRTVLLVTGVTIPAEWFDGIKTRLERDGFKTVTYEPPELLSYDLFEATEDLKEVVERVRDESGEDKIDILAECTGGLIARHYVQSLGGDQAVNRLVTFVSPQAGVDLAPKARLFAPWPALEGLSPGSDFLNAVHTVSLPAEVDMTSIYTCDDEYIKPYTTSIVEGATNIGLCDPTEFVGHFRTMYDPEIYLIMYDALTTPLSFAPAPVVTPAVTNPADVDPDVQDIDDVDDVDAAHADPAADAPDADAACTTSTVPGNPGLLVLLFLGAFLIRRRRS